MSDIPCFISVDDHAIEPPDMFEGRLPSKYQNLAPKCQRGKITGITFVGGQGFEPTFGEDGADGDYWTFQDRVVWTLRRNISGAGLPPEQRDLSPTTYEAIRPGCWDPKERLTDMDLNHTEASLCFPSLARFCGQTFLEGKDKDISLACLRAYNDWVVEGWCEPAGGRLIPLTVIPLWDGQLAAEEVYRNAARGVRAVTFSELPSFLGLPTIHDQDGFWDPFFRACNDTGTVICMHIGSSSQMPSTGKDAPAGVSVALSCQNAMSSLADYLLSGVLVRFPELKLAYSEANIGWIPYILERTDDVWNYHRGWAGLRHPIPEPPSTYYYQHVYGCFVRDFHGLQSLDKVGVDNVTFESDYPHADSTWPDTLDTAKEMFEGLDDETIYKICRGNAVRMLELDLDHDR